MSRKLPIVYGALTLTAVNLLLRFVGTGFQVYISNRLGANVVGLLQLILSVNLLAMTAGIAGIRTTAMYLTAEELGKKQTGKHTPDYERLLCLLRIHQRTALPSASRIDTFHCRTLDR